MKFIERYFEREFETWGFCLPSDHVRNRQSGRITHSGWVICYLFGSDSSGEYLDFHASHRMTSDTHMRVYENGETRHLQTTHDFCPRSTDPEEDARLQAQHFERNRRVARQLEDKGFGIMSGDTQPTARSPLTRAAQTARQGTPWDGLNAILYEMCALHRSHDNVDTVATKLVMIGRVYAAALERRTNARESTDEFYLDVAAPRVVQSDIDKWIETLPADRYVHESVIAPVLGVHKRLVDLFAEIAGGERRSFASKYLHFHRPDLFFIFDSRADAAARRWAPGRKRRQVVVPESDDAYHLFFERCADIVDRERHESGTPLSTRELDNLLLRFPDGPG